jgi:hypothetical protein
MTRPTPIAVEKGDPLSREESNLDPSRRVPTSIHQHGINGIGRNIQWMETVSPFWGKFFPSPGEILSIVTPILIAVDVNVLYDLSVVVGRRRVRSI